MNKSDLVTRDYDPNHFLNTIGQKLQTNNDAALAKKLNIAKAVLSAIRHKRLAITGSFLLWVHQATGMHIAELRALMGDRRRRLRCARSWVGAPDSKSP